MPGWPSSGGCGRANRPTRVASRWGRHRTRSGGPPLWAAAMGPKSMARAAKMGRGDHRILHRCRSRRDRPGQPHGCRRLGVRRTVRTAPAGQRLLLPAGRVRAEADAELKRFARAYLAVFGDRAAEALSQLVELSSPGRLLDALAAAEAAGCDEFILVPGTVDPDCLARTTGCPDRLTDRDLGRRTIAGGSDREVLALPHAGLRGHGSRAIRTASSDLVLEVVDLALQRPECHPDQVGQQGVSTSGGRCCTPRPAAGDDLAGHADDHRVGRHVADDDGVGPDPAARSRPSPGRAPWHRPRW